MGYLNVAGFLEFYMKIFFFSRLLKISEQWQLLEQKTSEKSMKLKEANRQRTFIAAVKDLDFWLGEVSSNVS